eukprot:7524406-Pyramimonas_sp.AAC.1
MSVSSPTVASGGGFPNTVELTVKTLLSHLVTQEFDFRLLLYSIPPTAASGGGFSVVPAPEEEEEAAEAR